MLSTLGKIVFLVIIFCTFFAFIIPVYYRFRIIKTGQPDQRFNQIGRRIWSAFTKILFQRCTLKNERILSGFMHVFIFYGALTFDTMTVNHTLEGLIPGFYLFGTGNFSLFFSLIVDTFAILVIIGVLFFAIRRFIIRPKAYQTTLMDSAIIYIMLILVTLSYIYFEIFAIAHHPGTERLSFLGAYFSNMVGHMSAAAINTHFHIGWWIHILLVYAFIAYVPHSKYFHMFAGSFNVLVNRDRPMGEYKAMDIENSEVFGIEKATDYTWKDLLDTFACMECGRCQDVCPAASSDKPLSPKMLILNLKAHLLQEGKKYIAGEQDKISPLMKETVTGDEIWTCTTCGACMHVCPVEIEHIPKIIGLRQSQVLMESNFPNELNTFFRNMETNSNPWGIGFSERGKWAEGLDVKLANEKPGAEYLLWVGCAGSFDEQGKKIAQSMVKVLNHAEIDYVVLGPEEKCCGDSARRLGNEYLFQMQAAENIMLFSQYQVKKIITFCPHGYHTFKNEYPGLFAVIPELDQKAKDDFKQIQILHHSQFLAQLLQKNHFPVKQPSEKSFTYHDSCYLGRHNGIIQEPRQIIGALGKQRFQELKNNQEHSFCCGAGGGLMWTEENLGTRINHIRADEIIQTEVELALTSCPFCQTMLLDALKDKGKENIQVKDIAQLIAEAL